MNKSELKNLSGVYALTCPDSGKVRYVGRSKNILSRYYGHRSATKDLPVNQWCKKLSRNGKAPEIKVLEKHAEPEKVEAKWIKAFRDKGEADLNLHDGGPGFAMSGSGRCEEAWSVEEMPGPFPLLVRTLWSLQNNKSGKKVMQFWKDRWDACESELDRINTCMQMYQVVQSLGTQDLRVQIERWAIAAATQINKKYPGRVTLEYNDGVEVTP